MDLNPHAKCRFSKFNLKLFKKRKTGVTYNLETLFFFFFYNNFQFITFYNCITASRYLDDILNINNVYFDNMVSKIYPSDIIKLNTSDTEAAFVDLHLSISNVIVSTEIYDKRGDSDFDIVNFPFLVGDS